MGECMLRNKNTNSREKKHVMKIMNTPYNVVMRMVGMRHARFSFASKRLLGSPSTMTCALCIGKCTARQYPVTISHGTGSHFKLCCEHVLVFGPNIHDLGPVGLTKISISMLLVGGAQQEILFSHKEYNMFSCPRTRLGPFGLTKTSIS